MKKTTLCSMLAFFSYFLAAQSVTLDSTFGVNGVIVTDMHDTNFNTYGNNLVGLPNEGVVIVGEMYDSGSDFLAVEKFNGNGIIDSGFTTFPKNMRGFRNGASSQQDGRIIVVALWVYPNPIAEQFTLQFGLVEPAQASVHLFDLQGKLVQSFVQNQSFVQGDHTLNLYCPSHLPTGNYVLTMEVAGKKMKSVQIVKQ